MLACVWVAPVKAFMTPEISSAMDEANICQEIRSVSAYIECMTINNNKILTAIKDQSQVQTQGFSRVKKNRTLKKIDLALKANLKRCFDEQSLNHNPASGQRRYSYCSYENMLEILINVSNRIEIYSRR
ncbi:MAG: hypothetical protein Q9M92_08730 [Enterobacterales bacterium]|nr:hypothetical protein [Enterobacterales bacterium]